MGRCVVTPLVKMNGQEPPAPRLLWYDVTRIGEEAGEILAAFELFLVCATTNTVVDSVKLELNDLLQVLNMSSLETALPKPTQKGMFLPVTHLRESLS